MRLIYWDSQAQAADMHTKETMKSKGSKINFSLGHFWVSTRQRDVPLAGDRAKVPACNLLIRRMVVATQVQFVEQATRAVLSFSLNLTLAGVCSSTFNLTSELRTQSLEGSIWGSRLDWKTTRSLESLIHTVLSLEPLLQSIIPLRKGVLRRRLFIGCRFMLGNPGRRIWGRVMPLLMLVRL